METFVALLNHEKLAVGCPEASFLRPETNLRMIVRECAPVSSARETHTVRRNEIHLWHAEVSATELYEFAQHAWLSENESARMMRFHFEKDRQNFLFCRSMLRILLASYLGDPPAELCFAYSAHGKPTLASSSGSLEFNLSHSNGNFLVAITLGRKVGVDIEFLNRDLDVLEIAQRFFSSAERQAIQALPDTLQHDAFFSCWTRKEAFVKARGEGLSRPLDSFDVSVMPDEETVSLATRPDNSEADRWTLLSLNCFPGFKAALAVESENAGPIPS
jgi:4'-phosphopantetheinyl transferase